MRKKKIGLLFLLSLFVIATIPLISRSGGGPSGGGGKKGPSTPPCPTYTYATCTVNAPFFMPYSGQTTMAPEPLSNPQTQNGTNVLTQPYSYYFKITLKPNGDPGCPVNGETVTFWTTAANNITIQVPKETTSTLTVEFYERCGFYDNAFATARRYWRFTTTLSRGQTFINPSLTRISTIFGC